MPSRPGYTIESLKVSPILHGDFGDKDQQRCLEHSYAGLSHVHTIHSKSLCPSFFPHLSDISALFFYHLDVNAEAACKSQEGSYRRSKFDCEKDAAEKPMQTESREVSPGEGST